MIELLQLKASMKLFFPLFFCHILLCFSTYSRAIDSLLPNQSLLDNSQSLVSVGGSFELGFFSPWPSNKRYVGIWFKNVTEQTAVWVANKNNPLPDSSGVLMITAAGNILILNNKSDIPVWSSNSLATSGNPVLQLLNSGNLVVKDGSSGNYLWQSFDHPCDTIIPGMKLGWNLETKENWFITSWKSLQDPADEDYTYKVDPSGLPQLVLHKGSEILFRSGPWDGVKFGGGAPLQQFAYFEPIFVLNSTFVYFSFINIVSTAVSRFVLNQSGLLQHLLWSQRRGEWIVSYAMQVDQCDDYAKCGPNGFCNVNASPLCQCLPGFIPKVPQDWNQLDWTSGCVRRTPLNCTSDGGFLRLTGLKLPDGSELLVNGTAMSPMECKKACLRNCSCMAYTTTKVSDCVAWFGDLLDIRETSFGGQEIYIRMAAADIRSTEHKGRAVVIIPVAVSAVGLLISVIWCVIWKRNAWRTQDDMPSNPIQDGNPNAEDMDLYHLPLYDLVTIVSATNNFSYANKIGEGGFGAVYRGKLSTGQEIAVKRLSKDSGQGLKEFKNEVIFISRLQHRNLVRLLGCCIHGEERMLVYEYMPRRSLDLYIYNQTRGTSLDWSVRFNVIVGIARGLLYLHRDSRLRIIHRDLKVSNILLDDDMTPKISDFGLARTFGGDQNEENTKRVLGTYGYMSPEYAIDGLFSMKSDVFSFGVLVLEIISGKKNRGFLHPDHDLNLLGHAWRLWIEGRSSELVDIAMERPFPTSEAAFSKLKCIHVGLLCVQLRPEDRPTMASVVSMLDSENPMLPEPKQPGFYTERFFNDTEPSSTSDQRRCYTQNEVTITLLQGR